jgi:TolB-like protein
MRRMTAMVAVWALLPGLAMGQAGPKKIRVAVMEIRPLGTEQVKSDLLSEVALTEAAAFERLEIIGRSDIASMIGFEQQKKVLGCVEDSSCLAEIGGALGVDYVLIGSLGRLGTLYRVDLKVVDTKKARVLGRFGESVTSEEEKLVAAVQKGVRQLLTPILGGDLPVPVVTRPTPGTVPLPPPPVARPAAPATPVAAQESGMSRAGWGWTAAGGGAALVAVGAIFGMSAQKAFSDEKAATTLDAYNSAKSKVKSSSLLADVFFVTGAVGLGTGGYLLFTGKPSVAVVPTEGGAVAMISGRF